MSFTDRLLDDFGVLVRDKTPKPVVHKAFESKPLGLVAPTHAPMSDFRVRRSMLAEASRDRFDQIIREATSEAVKKLGVRRTNTIHEISVAFEQAVQWNCHFIIQAAKVDQKKRKEKEKKARQMARRDLAEGLKSGRRRLRDLNMKIYRAESEAMSAVAQHEQVLRVQLAQRLDAAKTAAASELLTLYPERLQLHTLLDGYESVPPPTIEPHKEGENLPSESGIYFLWLDGVVDYVGRSIRLRDRLKLGGHHVLEQRHRISYLLMPRRELTWAECYYIGITKPQQNFGKLATHAGSTT